MWRSVKEALWILIVVLVCFAGLYYCQQISIEGPPK